ncbi:MAG: hypothetical protein ACRDSR_21025 [Pseudonocardiaceae bacterium]
MIIEVMCRIADGPLGPGELEVTQAGVPLVSWSVNAHDVSQARDLRGQDLAVELHLSDDTVWTGEAYSADLEPEAPLRMQLRGIGPLSENSVPVHADVVVQRIDALLAERQH